MNCKHCGGWMADEYDRHRCFICGRSEWHKFTVRKPLKEEMRLTGGRDSGPPINGSDKIQARI